MPLQLASCLLSRHSSLVRLDLRPSGSGKGVVLPWPCFRRVGPIGTSLQMLSLVAQIQLPSSVGELRGGKPLQPRIGPRALTGMPGDQPMHVAGLVAMHVATLLGSVVPGGCLKWYLAPHPRAVLGPMIGVCVGGLRLGNRCLPVPVACNEAGMSEPVIA